MSEEDIERLEELDRKIDDGIATDDEMMERDALWSVMQMEEEQELKNSFQFGY